MTLDKTTLIEIEDYIEHLHEKFGLSSHTMKDIALCIDKYRTELRKEKSLTPNKEK